ncbi:P-loop containing nucleoside triphosphate hydrolase protein [Rickenella mellea]|uniref:P-loop containing nucleoside triphosphate hydrolase protein n=1 Tax=Rickenella mellea TaxID=50990 RepID=A0A4Y7QJB5_9AGAM|nr:P-loop containing nucleoside triphosphate hydrolase protein [Rickenella mellea]
MSITATVLELEGLSCSLGSSHDILHDISLTIREGDILILQGKSGCGKTTLLKCLAHLNVYDGIILFHGQTPKSYGIPNYRTRVFYVPQRPSLLPGTPRDFLDVISKFAAQQARRKSESKLVELRVPIDISEQWGVTEDLWDRKWAELSGGESQRIALAAAVGMNTAEILLLDEPTSALDAETSLQVEKYLTRQIADRSSSMKAIVWITHSAEQGGRVGTRFITVADGGCREADGPFVPNGH